MPLFGLERLTLPGGLRAHSLTAWMRLDAPTDLPSKWSMVDDMRDEDPGKCSILHALSREQARRRVHELLDDAVRGIEASGPRGRALAGLAQHLEGLLP